MYIQTEPVGFLLRIYLPSDWRPSEYLSRNLARGFIKLFKFAA